MEAWKFANVEICLGKSNSNLTRLGSLEMWNMEMWNLEQLNSYITKLEVLEMWKSGNLEICLGHLETWKCLNINMS